MNSQMVEAFNFIRVDMACEETHCELNERLGGEKAFLAVGIV